MGLHLHVLRILIRCRKDRLICGPLPIFGPRLQEDTPVKVYKRGYPSLGVLREILPCVAKVLHSSVSG